MLAKLANFALFQVVWFACVLGAANDALAVGLGVAGAALVAALLLSDARARDGWLVLCVGFGGFWIDTLEIALGVYTAPGARLFEAATPWWFVVLWAGFATTLCSSFAWALTRPWLAVALGAVAGPIAYLSGERLGALTLGEPKARALAILAVAWALALWASIKLARRLDARFGAGRPGRDRRVPPRAAP
ncbi:MAG: DUF2878 domain-containing protein [Planctomycetes bacterium]|nr:DUF2878 domain-containing protein [Planctomycetota bacterium]